MAVTLKDVDPRRPFGRNQSGLAPQQLAAATEGSVQSPPEAEILEKPIHLLGESAHERKRGLCPRHERRRWAVELLLRTLSFRHFGLL